MIIVIYRKKNPLRGCTFFRTTTRTDSSFLFFFTFLPYLIQSKLLVPPKKILLVHIPYLDEIIHWFWDKSEFAVCIVNVSTVGYPDFKFYTILYCTDTHICDYGVFIIIITMH